MPQDMQNRATQMASWMQDGEQRRRTLHIRRLRHYYGEGDLRKQVLFDNDLDVHEGEIVIMTGPSGSGKTTLLTLIGTLRTVQAGTLEVLGRDLRETSPRERSAMRREIGFIFQAHNLFNSLTAMQNVSMGLEQLDLPRAEVQRRAKDILTRLGLGHRLHHKPQLLSGGQKQRVAIARALAHHPRIVLADEPTAALDETSGREVVTLFQELARDLKITIIMVTHDNRILDVADRIVNMVDGRIKSDAVVREVAVICEFIQKLPAFRGLTPGTLSTIADQMRVEKHPPGNVVIRQGDVGEKFYLIRHGHVEVVHEDRDGTQPVATLGEGDCFGEMSLLTGAPRSATVRAGTDTLLYALGKEDFRAAVATSASLREELQKALFERQ